MCGIIGLLKKEGPIFQSDERRVRSALVKMAYRGPDGEGVWKSGSILLGHRRLSIIDLSAAGAQPFEIPDRGLVITFNGEIYNYKELRETLVAKGFSFRSNTDTEVLLRAYDCYGIDFLRHLRGMFAFCLIDSKKNVAILARDPAGEKPFYYYFDSNRLIFSSEIKAFHAFPEIDLSIDEESVKAFFALQYIPGPHTIYSNIKKLSAGVALEIDLSEWKPREHRYWSIEKNDTHYGSTPDEIESLLAQSVRYRLVADVEVGLLLSGGIDSTLLAFYASKAGANLRVFTARFDRRDLDETRYARHVAESLGMPQVIIDGGKLDADTFDKIIFHADEPLGDPACIPTFLLARELSNHVTVVLSGEGADELFWGYDAYRYERLWRWAGWMQYSLNRFSRYKDMVSEWEGSSCLPNGLTRITKLFSAAYDLGSSRWTSVFADHTITSRLMPAVGAARPFVYLKEMEAKMMQLRAEFGWLSGSLSTDLCFWLPDDLLTKVDRMMMAHGVEARAPYLDSDLMVAALSLPEKYKMNGSQGKLILRNMVEKRLPGIMGKSLARRKKHGFEVPVSEWLKNTLRACVEERFSVKSLSQSGLLDSTYVRKLWDSFLATPGETSMRRKLWLIFCFQSWFEQHQKKFGFHTDIN
jgi:asparagine synthase (glutamine-hydrolysing)